MPLKASQGKPLVDGCAHWDQLGSQQLWQMLSIPIVLCRVEPDAPKSEEIWTQRFSADGRVRNNHPIQGKGETREGEALG